MSVRSPMRFTWLAGLLAVALASLPLAAHAATADLFNGFQAKSKDPVEVTADVLNIADQGKQRVSTFSGNVTVRRGDTMLKAKEMKLFSNLDTKAGGGFTRIEASGGVVVTSADQTVTGKTAVVDMKTHIITVSGGVVLTQGGNVLTGSRLVVNLTTGKARVEQEAGKQIRGIFTPATTGGPAAGQ